MKTPGTIIMLPTEKASIIGIRTNKNTPFTPIGNMAFLINDERSPDKDWKYQHFYIISDDEIKEGDWYIDFSIGSTKKPLKASEEFRNNIQHKCFKIIATTDESIGNLVKGFDNSIPSIPDNTIRWLIEYHNEHKKFPKVVFDLMEDPISIFNDEDSCQMVATETPMTKAEIIQWMIDAYVMIGDKNDEGEDEGKCLLNALIHKLKAEKQ